MDLKEVAFSWYDYILFSLMLGASALIGVYFGCFGNKQSTANEYLMGGKKMKVFPISMSLIASHVSGITLLAVPADVYRFGAAYWILVFCMIFVYFVTVHVFLPVFFKLQITSTYEYLEKRYDSKNRMLASFLFALSLLLYLPIVIYIPALAFSAATGVNVHLITPIVCGVCIFYTTIGGLKAVVWTDTLQFTITIGTIITVFILGVKSVGGFENIWENAINGQRLNIFDFDPDPTKRDSFWIVLIGIGSGWTSMTSINQGCTQKFLSVATFREAKLCVIYFAVGIVLISSFSVFTGLIMYTKYANCDPFTTGQVQRNDQLLPYYVMDVAADVPGLSGLFIAGVFCAALSTLSASLNCLAGTIFEDFISKYIGNKYERASSHILKILVVVIGVICTALVFIIEHLGGILPLAISLSGVTTGPLLAMFTLGVLFPKSTSRGTFYGSLTGLLFVSWIVVMAQFYKSQGLIQYEPKPTSIKDCYDFSNFTLESNTTHFFTNATKLNSEETTKPFILFRISYYYYCLLGVGVTMITALIISHFDKSKNTPVDRDLLSPVIYFLLTEDNHYILNNGEVGYCDINKAVNLVTLNTEEKNFSY